MSTGLNPYPTSLMNPFVRPRGGCSGRAQRETSSQIDNEYSTSRRIVIFPPTQLRRALFGDTKMDRPKYSIIFMVIFSWKSPLALMEIQSR